MVNKPARKKNMQDATLINIHALKAEVKKLKEKLLAHEKRLKAIEKFLMRA